MKEECLIRLDGRIDGTNARDWEERVMGALAESPDVLPVFDASGLTYISSAGLRVLMKTMKACPEKPEIREVSPEIYEILEMTGFTELMRVKKKMREVSVEGCPVIGRGFYGTVYRLDEDTIVKVYRSPDSIPMIENERKMARLAFVKGIPTAISYDIVKVGDSYGSVFEMLKARTLNDLLIENPERADEIVGEFVGVLKKVHAAEIDPGVLPSAKAVWMGYLEKDREDGFLREDGYRKLKGMLEEIPECPRVVHGDFHMKNVMRVEGESMLIDMDTLTAGDPIFDLQGIYMTYREFGEDEPGNTMSFLGIDERTSDYVWRKSLADYFGTDDADFLARATDRIRLVAALRFLTYLDPADAEGDSLNARRIRHTTANIRELLTRTDSLLLDAPGGAR